MVSSGARGGSKECGGTGRPRSKEHYGVCERRRDAWLEGQGPDRARVPASPSPSSALHSWAALPGTSLAPSHTQQPDHLTGMSRPRVLHLCCSLLSVLLFPSAEMRSWRKGRPAVLLPVAAA